MAGSTSFTDVETAISAGWTPISTARRRAANPRFRRNSSMDIADLLTPASVIATLRVASKKQALQELARRAAPIIGLPERRVYEALGARARVWSAPLRVGHAR